MGFNGIYPLVNKQLDPENHQFLMETSLPTPMTARVYVNLPEGNYSQSPLPVIYIYLYGHKLASHSTNGVTY